MKQFRFFLLIGVGLLNLYPAIGAISVEQIANLYGIKIDSPDLETLMRHRAVMLGLVGGFLLLAAFRSSLQAVAASIGLVSMSSFVLIAFLVGGFGEEINSVVIADIVGSIAAAMVLVTIAREGRHAA